MRRYIETGRRTQEVVQIRNRGLGELISDLVSIYLFNIGSLFSSESFCNMVRDLDDFSFDRSRGYYPPWRMRLRLMYEELEFRNVENVINEYEAKTSFESQIKKSLLDKFQKIKSIVSDTSDEVKINADGRSRIAYASIKSAIPCVRTYLDNRISKYDLERCYKHIMNQCERIHYRIPPNAVEVGGIPTRISDLQSIIIAGWVYKVAYLSTMFSSREHDKYLDDLTALNNLLSKAMELSDIQREYEEHKSRQILLRQS